MYLDTSVRKFLAYADDPVVTALDRISKNKQGVVFVTDQHGVIEGVLTDGDFRRWIIESGSIDLQQPAINLANRDFVKCRESADRKEVEALLSERIKCIPMLDSSGRLVAVALSGEQKIVIGSRAISEDHPAFIIAEIGNNHNGDINSAFRLVDEVVESGADCAKFQMRTLSSLYRKAALERKPEDLGAEYTLDLLTRFQLSDDDLFKVMDYAREQGVEPLCTPWDEESLQKLNAYGVSAFKIASADLTNHDLLAASARVGKPLIVSTGMSTETEIRAAIDLLKRFNTPFVLLQCNSTYPTPMEDINLTYMSRLRALAGVPVGYSGHERGIEVPIAAVSLGAKVIEKHITLDPGLEGTDHKISLIPSEFKEMVRAIRNVEMSLGAGGSGRNLTQGELMNRENLAKSLIAAKEIKKGDVLENDMIAVRSPGSGLPPYRRQALVGRVATRDIHLDEFFTPSDIGETSGTPREYSFGRPWGIPVRFHDMEALTDRTNPDLFEFHLSYRDLEIEIEEALNTYDTGVVVHSPELFSSDHILDLCSNDLDYRAKSISELNRVTEFTRKIGKFFPREEKPRIVVNVGGVSELRHIDTGARKKLYQRLVESLEQIDATGVELIPQTMPPFPWHFGGQRFHNLMVDADEIAEFCNKVGMNICLDISHSKLACTHYGWSLSGFVEKIGPYVSHIHVADAEGTSGEGLQIGEGDIDFPDLALHLNKHCPEASFIPEIWQGHKNSGAGFWTALAKMEQCGF